MPKLSILEKNAYINVLIKDNGIWGYLAYMDYNANREYILSDYTDINSLRFLLDDNIFTKDFWFEYFDNLENVFNWNIVDKDKSSIFTFRRFKEEGDGISGVRVQIDDNQEFFREIFDSVRDFSNDVSLRVVDDKYMNSILEGILRRMNLDDLMLVDMDLFDFSIFRVKADYEKGKPTGKLSFTKSKLSWKDEISLIDSVKDSRFNAFLATEISSENLFNIWGNFVIDKPLVVQDNSLLDIIRAYSTIQNFSIYRDNKAKIEGFGREYTKTAMIVTGNIPRVLGLSKTMLSIIDGLEIAGNFDCYFDLDLKTVAFGQSYVSATESTDIILTKGSILPKLTKVIIPLTKSSKRNRVLLSGNIESLDMEKSDFYALSSQYTVMKLPRHEEKMILSMNLRNGAKTYPLGETSLEYISIPGVSEIGGLVFDFRQRPIVYGPDAYTNRVKLQSWINDN